MAKPKPTFGVSFASQVAPFLNSQRISGFATCFVNISTIIALNWIPIFRLLKMAPFLRLVNSFLAIWNSCSLTEIHVCALHDSLDACAFKNFIRIQNEIMMDTIVCHTNIQYIKTIVGGRLSFTVEILTFNGGQLFKL